MIRDILKMGDPRLLRVARPIEDIHDPALSEIIADMYETMHAANGVGLATPQIGLDLRLPGSRPGFRGAIRADPPLQQQPTVNLAPGDCPDRARKGLRRPGP